MTEAALAAAKGAIEAVLQDEANERLGRGKYEWRFLSRSLQVDPADPGECAYGKNHRRWISDGCLSACCRSPTGS